jgi:hypothetical protein
MRSTLFLVLFAFAPLTDAITQELPLQRGQRVRVTVPAINLKKHADMFRELRGDTLVLYSMSCSLSDVTRLDVFRGQKSAWAYGLGFGVLAGAVTGAVIGFASGSEEQGPLFSGKCLFVCTAGEKAAVGAIALGAVGGLLGLWIGTHARINKWEEVPLGRFRPHVVPAGRGFNVGARVTF